MDVAAETLRLLRELREEVQAFRGQVTNDIHELKGDVHELKGDVHELKGDVHELKGDVHELKGDIHLIREHLRAHDARFDDVTRQLGEVAEDIIELGRGVLSSFDRDRRATRRLDAVDVRLDSIEKDVAEIKKRTGGSST